ncbi:MAG: GntR family transcriptional regulator [Desulfobacterales bacterium]|nr:GntR family transcriptional regulator [Desulfobacterales bacterium]
MTIQIQSLREQVYQYFRDEMQQGTLAPGATINLNAMSRELGVSKTPLRDALIQLEIEGFVTILPRRGVMVRRLALEDVRDCYGIIGALEASVIRYVFAAMGPDEILRMKQLNEDQRKAFAHGEHLVYYQKNLDFHDVFLALSPNATLLKIIIPMKQRLYDFPRQAYVAEWEMRNMDDHDRFIAMIESGDVDGAAHLMQHVHWSYSVQEDFILEFYRAAELRNSMVRG